MRTATEGEGGQAGGDGGRRERGGEEINGERETRKRVLSIITRLCSSAVSKFLRVYPILLLIFKYLLMSSNAF